MSDELNSTRQLLASLGAQRGSAPAASSPGVAPAASGKLVKDEEIREFGPDLYDFIKRAAREATTPEIESRLRPVTERVTEVAQTATAVRKETARSAEQKVHDLLAQQVPNYLELDKDPAFLAWLDVVDPYSGHKRVDLLQAAYKRHDGPRVVAFFTGYLNEHAAVTPPAPTPAPAATPAPQVSLESMVAPGTAKAGTAGAQDGAGKRIWTRAEITTFYNEVQRGKFRNDAAGRKAIETDIFNAQREGRVR